MKPLKLVSHHLPAPWLQGSAFSPGTIQVVPTSHPTESGAKLSHQRLNKASRTPAEIRHATARFEYTVNGQRYLLLARSLDDAHLIELSVVLLEQYDELPLGISETNDPASQASHTAQFLFPAAILPGFDLILDEYSEEVHFVALTATGWLFRLRFTRPGVFTAPNLPYSWSCEHQTSNLNSPTEKTMSRQGEIAREGKGRHPTLVHVVDSGLVLVACSDGTLLKLEQSRSDEGDGRFAGAWKESILRSSSFFKTFSRFFSRDPASSQIFASPGPASEPMSGSSGAALSQIVGLTTLVRADASVLAFCLSRDRKVKVWDLVAEQFLTTVDLPLMDQQRTIEDVRTTPPFSAEGPMRPFVTICALGASTSSGNAVYLLVYVPAPLPSGSTFALYSVDTGAGPNSREIASTKREGASGNSVGVTLLWEQGCDPLVDGLQGELRDAAITADSSGSCWTLWSLWDIAGRTLVQRTSVDLESEDNDDGWITSDADTAKIYSSLRSPDFQRMTELSSREFANFYLPRIFEAGRYCASNIIAAIDRYRTNLANSLVSSRTALPAALLSKQSFASLPEQVALTVGSAVTLDVDPVTGALQHAVYAAAVDREWQRFIGLLEEADGHSRWPVALLHEQTRPPSEPVVWEEPLILTRERILALTTEDRIESMIRWADGSADTSESPPRTDLRAIFDKVSFVENDDGRRGCLTVLQAALDFTKLLHQDTYHTILHNACSTAGELPAAQLTEQVCDWWPDDLEVSWKQDWHPRLLKLSDSSFEGKSGLEAILWGLTDLLVETSGNGAHVGAESPLLNTSFMASLLSDSVYQALRARRCLAEALLILVASILTEEEKDGSSNDPIIANSFQRLPFLLLRLIGIVQSLRASLALADSTEVPLPPSVDREDAQEAMTRRFTSLKVHASEFRRRHTSLAADSLLHACILQRVLLPRLDAELQDDTPISLASLLVHGVGSILVQLGLPPAKGSHWQVANAADAQLPRLHPSQAELCRRLLGCGYARSAHDFAQMYPPSPAVSYIVGCSLLRQGLYTDAAISFDKTLCGIASLAGTDGEASDERRCLRCLLPQATTQRAADPQAAATYFLLHVADLYRPSPSTDEQVAYFAASALQSARASPKGLETVLASSGALQDLFSTLFTAHLRLSMFAACYNTVMGMTPESLRRDSLRTLISAMCEAGHISQLLDFNFAALQPEVERNLSFKARNSDPLVEPNYYHILYSYYAQRADFKSAGAVMYQQGRRLNDIHLRGTVLARPNAASLDLFVEVSVQQARAYVAALNALSLLDGKDAWFADAVATTSSYDPDESDRVVQTASQSVAREAGNDRQLTSHIPPQHWQSGSKTFQIVRPDDVRREYHLVLARLELVQAYPDLVNPASLISHADMVAFLVRREMYDKALTTARALGTDRSSAFAALTVKCAQAQENESFHSQQASDMLSHMTSDASQHGSSSLLVAMTAEFPLFAHSGDLHPDQSKGASEQHDELLGWDLMRTSDRTSAWMGSIAERGWRYLRTNLRIEDKDGATNGWHYRLVVLKTLLNLRRQAVGDGTAHPRVPQWMIDWFNQHNPDLLIKAYIDAGLIDESLECCISLLQRGNQELRGAKESASAASAPYLVIDNLLQRSCDSSTSTTATSALVQKLRGELGPRFELLDHAWIQRSRRNIAMESSKTRDMDWS
ncbi:unnamed protein product [Jaminaea pallidilutea]